MQVLGPKARRHSRRDEHGRNQHHAYGLQAHDHRQRDQPHQQGVDPAGRVAERLQKVRVENQRLELLKKQGHREDDEARQHTHHAQVVIHQRGRLPKEELVQTALIARADPLDVGQQHDPHAKKYRQHNANRRIRLDAGIVDDELHHQHAEHPGNRRARQQHWQGLAPSPQIGQRHPGQGRVRQRVADETPPPQHRKRPQQPAGRADQQRAEKHEAHIGVGQAQEPQGVFD